MEPAGDLADRAYLARTHRLCRSGIRELQEARAHGGKARRLMLAYIVRRVLYAIPILIGVNLLSFLLFFVVNTPDDMARMQLGTRRVTTEAIEKWKAEQGYDKPMLFNARAAGLGKLTDTIFFEQSVRLFDFDFGAEYAECCSSYAINRNMYKRLYLVQSYTLRCTSVSHHHSCR